MSTSLSPLLAPMLSSAAMRAVCDDAACLQNMLDFEAALARAEAATGVIPQSAAGPIAAACRAESFDLAALADASTRSGNLAIPLVKALTSNVAKQDADAARYVHWGATSQDVIDTATMLTLRAAIDILLGDIDRAVAGFAKLARHHRNTAVVARTWLQHALPMPFGLKLAEYAAALHRSRKRLQRLCAEALALQFGGAAGTHAAHGDK
jgi:3-carboxy-cis,cis-muconate cycloisomerase